METIDLLADGRLDWTNGDWQRSEYLDVKKSEPFTIFESEYEPGLVAWPALWKERDGSLRLVFTEVQGDPCDWPPSYAYGAGHHRAVQRYFRSDDGGLTWDDLGWQEENDPLWLINSDPHCVRILAREDGSLVRICHQCAPDIKHEQPHATFDADLEAGGHFPFRGLSDSKVEIYPEFFTVQESFDSGRSWQSIFTRNGIAAPNWEEIKKSREPGIKMNYDWWATGSRILEDGALAWIGRSSERDALGMLTTVLSIAESNDNGHTWCTPIPLLRNRGLFESTALTEEADFVSLGSGRYLALVRTDTAGHCIQLLLERNSPGDWRVADSRYSTVPHSGFPFMLKCADGTILHQGLGGHWSTIDEGQSWAFHDTMECYYGQMLEIEPGRVLAVTQVDAADEPYPHRYDATIRGCFLSHQRRLELRQNDSCAGMVMATTDGIGDDGHLLARMQVHGSAGLVARVNADQSSFYALVIQCGTDAMRFAGAPVPKAARLVISLCRVTSGSLHVLAQRSCDAGLCGDDWFDVQFTVKGNELKAAVRVNGERATYLGARDAAFETGSWGVFTDLSKATFQRLQSVKHDLLMRDGWAYLETQ